jgi:hypothetical protein
VALLLFIPAGILIDRISRRAVYAIGFLLLALTYLVYPFADSMAELYLYRCTIYALGFVAVTAALSTVLVDYPAERSRGKLVAMVGFLCGLGVAVMQGFSALPTPVHGTRHDAVEAGRRCTSSSPGSAWRRRAGRDSAQAGVPVQPHQRPSVRETLHQRLLRGAQSTGAAGLLGRLHRPRRSSRERLLSDPLGYLAGKAAGIPRRGSDKAAPDHVRPRRSRLWSGRPSSGLFWTASTVSPRSPSAWCWPPSATCRCCCWPTRWESIGIVFFILLGIGQISVFLAHSP